jgi:hypothetical protein
MFGQLPFMVPLPPFGLSEGVVVEPPLGVVVDPELGVVLE